MALRHTKVRLWWELRFSRQMGRKVWIRYYVVLYLNSKHGTSAFAAHSEHKERYNKKLMLHTRLNLIALLMIWQCQKTKRKWTAGFWLRSYNWIEQKFLMNCATSLNFLITLPGILGATGKSTPVKTCVKLSVHWQFLLVARSTPAIGHIERLSVQIG